MEQNDLYLLQTVPAYHMQIMLKARSAAQALATGKPFDDVPGDPTMLEVQELADYLFEPESCRELLHTLSDPEVKVLRELVICGGRANSRDLALYLETFGSPFLSVATQVGDKHGTGPTRNPSMAGALSNPSLYPTPHPHGAFEQALHHLLVLGLLFWGKQTNFVGRDYANGVYDGVLIVPHTIRELVRQEWQLVDTQQLPLLAAEELPGEGIYTFQRALYLYWSLVAGMRDGLPLVSSHLLSRAALRQVIEQLAPCGKFLHDLSMELIHTESDAPPLLFLRLLLMKLGLLIERNNALYAAPAQDYFALPLAVRAWRCFHLWQETTFWNELVFLPEVVVRPGPGLLEAAHEEVVHARQQVIEHLWLVECEQLYPLARFVARMKLRVPYLLFPRQYGARAERYSMGSNPYGWDFRLRRGWLTHREGWHMVEGGFIRAMLTGPLYWLGVIECEGEGASSSFRLTRAAGLLASETMPDLLDPPWGRLVVQPNFDLVALAPIAERLLIELDRFAERASLEHIAQYHLSKASVIRAIQQGLTAATIQQLLIQSAGNALPQNVQYSLTEWERQARRIEVWRAATLLEVDDPALLDELSADPQAGAWLLRRLAPTLIEVSTRHLAHLQELLWQREYLPALTSATQHQDLLDGAPLPTSEAQWILLPDGLLQPRYALPNLYLAIELERVTQLDEASGWRRITSQALQKALNSGLALTQIIRFLQTYCVNGIPGSFLVRLKLWGQGYSERPSLTVEAAPLLSLSAQVLQDLLADEEIGALLGQSVAPETRVVHVAQENMELLKQLLQERGFEVL